VWNRCRCHCRHNDDGSGVGWIIFGMVMLASAAIMFSIAAVAFHIWVLCQIGLRLLDKQWWRAGWWFAVLLFLFYVDGAVLIALDVS
jgi:hypothetical protein